MEPSPRGGAPGTLYLIEPELARHDPATADAHAMDPEAVFASLRALGGDPGRVLIVGCEPASVEEGSASARRWRTRWKKQFNWCAKSSPRRREGD